MPAGIFAAWWLPVATLVAPLLWRIYPIAYVNALIQKSFGFASVSVPMETSSKNMMLGLRSHSWLVTLPPLSFSQVCGRPGAGGIV